MYSSNIDGEYFLKGLASSNSRCGPPAISILYGVLKITKMDETYLATATMLNIMETASLSERGSSLDTTSAETLCFKPPCYMISDALDSYMHITSNIRIVHQSFCEMKIKNIISIKK